jgi:3',5'-nucleoside bisphosphate phosphatase
MTARSQNPGIDLHCHSGFSVDGYGTPEAQVERAAELGLAALSITDHNSIGGTARAARAAHKAGIRYIPGLEIDLAWEDQAAHCHFLCYWYDPGSAGLQELLVRSAEVYEEQARWLLGRLARAGILVDRRELREWIHGNCREDKRLSMWRIGDYLRAMGKAPVDRSAVEHLLHLVGEDPPWPMPGLTEALPALRSAKALVVLAHPGRVIDVTRSVEPLRRLLQGGLIDGFEMYHKSHPAEPGLLWELEKEFGCAISGGSDCHDITRPDSNFGRYPHVPPEVIDTMYAAYCRRYEMAPR